MVWFVSYCLKKIVVCCLNLDLKLSISYLDAKFKMYFVKSEVKKFLENELRFAFTFESKYS